MAQSVPKPDIPLATGGTITNEILQEMLSLAADLQNNSLSHEGGTLLLQNLGPALAELAHRRKVMDLVHTVSDPENVIYLADQP